MSFHKFSGVKPQTLTAGGDDPPPAPNTQAGRGVLAPRCWDPNLCPLNFSAVVATLSIANV